MYQNNRRSFSRIQKQKSPKWPFVLAAIVVVCLLLGSAFLVLKNIKQDTPPPKTSEQTETFGRQQFSLTDPTSPWVIVNKKRPLSPKTYEPADLRTPNMDAEAGQQVNSQTATALEALAAAASSEGISLVLVSGYRSYDTQVDIYDSEVRGFGQAQADRESARPGYSEHQSGWAADLGAANGKCEIKACFIDTPEGKWLATNAYKYGFVIRYAEGKEHITGYMYEPWHLRFVGTDLSNEMKRRNIQTLEEFFELLAAPDYN